MILQVGGTKRARRLELGSCTRNLRPQEKQGLLGDPAINIHIGRVLLVSVFEGFVLRIQGCRL